MPPELHASINAHIDRDLELPRLEHGYELRYRLPLLTMFAFHALLVEMDTSGGGSGSGSGAAG